MFMKLTLELCEKDNDVNSITPDGVVLKYNWNDIINVKHMPTGEIQERLVSQISVYDDLVKFNNSYYRIVHALSKENF